MNDFILREAQFDKLPLMLTSSVPDFKKSREYRELGDYELDIPGVVSAAFAKYIMHLYEERLMHPSGDLDNKILLAHQTLEQLAVSVESVVQAVLTDEIFETFERDSRILKLIECDLLPMTYAAYEKWRGTNGTSEL
jgi:hypothetical protein